MVTAVAIDSRVQKMHRVRGGSYIGTYYLVPVSRDIVSPHKTIRGMNKSIPPDGIDRYRVSPLKLKLDVKHKMLMLNICSVNV